MRLPGYQIDAKLHESKKTLVYRGIRAATGEPTIIKAPNTAEATLKQIAQLRYEFEILTLLNRLQVAGVIKAHALESYHNTPALALEDIGGESLRKQLTSDGLSIPDFLNLALQITEIL